MKKILEKYKLGVPGTIAALVLTTTLLVGGAVSAQTTTPPSQSAQGCSIDTTLSVGSTGTEVQCLQSSLGVTVDGIFGPLTRDAVIKFQSDNGLVADGIFGPLSLATWEKNYPAPASGSSSSMNTNPTGTTSPSSSSTGGSQPGSSSSY